MGYAATRRSRRFSSARRAQTTRYPRRLPRWRRDVLLPRALILLKMLELRGLARRTFKQMKRPAGALFVVFYILMFLPMTLSAIFIHKAPLEHAAEWILTGAPLVLGVICVLSILMPETRVV